ncbi:preprotein translocase subunit YajC [Oxalobacter aliiformigenes]|uniref:Sec translocon accessory complex subunit YajC n=1 Tax=Oxalobacter aliiformigenes TaxID=2946593 RepID=A0A9E9NTE4_9BURK|nr:preprotein translocase subunit YajC [Oxalobacter aliiformigenes]WAV89418.1 preprotein translocase subunit YajC [Oxalobacter aliiformigenes]WAV91425.1 preprotein translocase subunit YajC [Oxalobacter aliiformigenes]WAV93505.1 preprotein translocase subunit YajC [Oxalobacter aliiformigenes]WAV94997.1 preprotein translocase subunit YajC [Oxalobacter aliiformigenes]WAV97201.1 preprotein translocase subunit YajC [Oxalobacter aliiformigenes]
MFITNAYAQSASSGFSLDSIGSYLPFLLLFVLLYFLMIRPQQKKQKEQRDMLSALAVGDEVLTAGGIVGKITKVTDNFITLEISEGTEIIIQKTSIVSMLPNGTIENL